MRRLLLLLLLCAVPASAEITGRCNTYSDGGATCINVQVQGSRMFISVTNRTGYSADCFISGSNGVYWVFVAYPQSTTRWWPINDVNAYIQWACV